MQARTPGGKHAHGQSLLVVSSVSSSRSCRCGSGSSTHKPWCACSRARAAPRTTRTHAPTQHTRAELQEITDNIRVRRNRIFLMMVSNRGCVWAQ